MKKSLIMLGALAGLAIGGATFVATKNNKVAETKAEKVSIYLTSKKINNWNNCDPNYQLEESAGNQGKITVTFEAGDLFKFTNGTWGTTWGWSNLNSGGGAAKPAFSNPNDENNIQVLVGGTYEFFLNSDNIYVNVGDISSADIVYVTANTASFSRIHLFGNKETDWPGAYSDSGLFELVSDVAFNGGYLYRVKVSPTLRNIYTKFILNDGGSNQTGDLVFPSTGNEKYYNVSGEDTASLLPSAKLVYKIRTAIYGATNQSLCNVTDASILSDYEAIVDKSVINAATIWTYKTGFYYEDLPSDPSKRYENVTVSSIIDKLDYVLNGSGAMVTSPLQNKTAAAVGSVSAVATIGGLSVGLFALVKKRRIL